MSVPGPALPTLTVAICTYNRAGLLRQTLAEIARQDYPAGRWEVIVVDNNSTDDTAAVVAAFPAVRYRAEPRQGANFARNRALAESQSEIIVFADDDILPSPDWLTRLAAPFVRPEGAHIGAVGGEVIPIFPDGCPDWIAGFHGPQDFRPDEGPIPTHRVPMSANLAFRRAVLAAVGGFDTLATRGGGSAFSADENRVIRRLHAAGYEVWFAPAAKVLHQMPAARTTFRYAARHAFGSARSRTIDRVLQGGATGWLLSRFLLNLLKAPAFLLLSALNLLVLRAGEAKKWLVRSWRSCGYLYQVPRSLCGRI